MLIQTLVLIAAMVVVSGAVFTSTLVTAKASLHQAVLAKSQTAMSDAQIIFTKWAAKQVEKYGTTAWPESEGSAMEPICSTTGGNTSLSPVPVTSCPFVALIRWRVTGNSSRSAPSFENVDQISQVHNLALTVDEERVSATITIRLMDAIASVTQASRSRKVTARIFDTFPYVVISGTRDVAATSGNIHTAEGDTGGTSDGSLPHLFQASPSPQSPSLYIGTIIKTSVDCINTNANGTPFSQTHPEEDTARWIDQSIRPYGNRDWADEMPCSPRYAINILTAPSDYATPAANIYVALPKRAVKDWFTGDGNPSSFAK